MFLLLVACFASRQVYNAIVLTSNATLSPTFIWHFIPIAQQILPHVPLRKILIYLAVRLGSHSIIAHLPNIRFQLGLADIIDLSQSLVNMWSSPKLDHASLLDQCYTELVNECRHTGMYKPFLLFAFYFSIYLLIELNLHKLLAQTLSVYVCLSFTN